MTSRTHLTWTLQGEPMPQRKERPLQRDQGRSRCGNTGDGMLGLLGQRGVRALRVR